MHCKRMYAVGQFVGQQLVYHAVTGQQAFALKCTADGDDLEVGFGSFGHIMHMAFVEYIEMQRRQAVHQFLFDSRLSGHEFIAAVMVGTTMGFPGRKINSLLLRNCVRSGLADTLTGPSWPGTGHGGCSGIHRRKN